MAVYYNTIKKLHFNKRCKKPPHIGDFSAFRQPHKKPGLLWRFFKRKFFLSRRIAPPIHLDSCINWKGGRGASKRSQTNSQYKRRRIKYRIKKDPQRVGHCRYEPSRITTGRNAYLKSRPELLYSEDGFWGSKYTGCVCIKLAVYTQNACSLVKPLLGLLGPHAVS